MMAHIMTLHTLVRLSLMSLASAALVGCGDKAGPVKTPTQTPSPTPQQEISPRVIFDQTSPSEGIRGGAEYLGTVSGMENMGRIADTNSENFAFYQVKRPDLSAGRYSFSALLKKSADSPEQFLVRIQPVINSSFARTDVLLSSDGTIIRISGEAENVTSNRNGQTGIDKLNLEFEVSDNESGAYRIFVYPAAALNNRFNKAATGELSVGEVSLRKVK